MIKHRYKHVPQFVFFVSVLFFSACGGSSGSDNTVVAEDDETMIEDEIDVSPSEEDTQLRNLIGINNLSGDPSIGRQLPNVNDPLPQLGKQLFFSKSLGGGFDSACVTCHHPGLGGADALSLSVGVGANSPDLLGEGREHSDGLPHVPRNAPTVFNVGLWDTGLFWDSRVESVGAEVGENGAASGIRTPDTVFGVVDLNAGMNLVEAQARFPVTSSEEMKTSSFENDSTNDAIRDHLAGRIGNYGAGENELLASMWLSEFQRAFNSTDSPEELITFANIATAIGEYERSMIFVDSPWKRYVDGDNSALSEQQKTGALLFFNTADDGGAGCVTCHSGDLFTDGSHALIAFPQIGPGKGDGNNDDFGRERETSNTMDRYQFRVPSLLNVALTAPYGHAGAYDTLEQVVQHYGDPAATVNDYFNEGGWCQLAQFESIDNCSDLYPNAEANTDLALERLQRARNDGNTRFQNINLNNNEVNQLVAFLESLTDVCAADRDCLEPWIADNTQSGPDGQQLNAVDQFLQPL